MVQLKSFKLHNNSSTTVRSLYQTGTIIAPNNEQYKAKYFAAYIDSGAGIFTAKRGLFPENLEEELPKIAGRDFSRRILILC